MNTPEPTTLTIWKTAQQKCWTHVEVATQMMRTLEALDGLHATSVIPILSDTQPCLLITPDGADDIVSIKAVCRWIKAALQSDADWNKLAINDEWLLRLKTGQVTIDILTRLPATQTKPIDL